MKIIFLDIDGVLNCIETRVKAPSGCIGVDDDKCERLGKIVKETGARVVLTSTWKKIGFDTHLLAIFLKMVSILKRNYLSIVSSFMIKQQTLHGRKELKVFLIL